MLWTSIAPELLVVAACNELMGARSICKTMKELDLGEEETWSLTHSYYANMRGFVVRNPSADKTIYHDPYHLNGEEILELRRRKHITKLPNITEAEIRDKSKGDMLGKSIVLGQIVWSLIQIIARIVRKLSVSPLEVAVVAFAVCAVLIYVLYWKKPQRVGVAYTIQLNDNHQLYNNTILEESPRFFKNSFRVIVEFFGISFKTSLLHGMPISVDSKANRSSTKGNATTILVIISVSAALFGGIHAIAWNFSFPSTIELVLWRSATIYTATAPVCAILLSSLGAALPNSYILTRCLVPLFIILFVSLIILYSIARLFIIVEMFRMLLFLPPGSFVSTWAASVPHVA